MEVEGELRQSVQHGEDVSGEICVTFNMFVELGVVERGDHTHLVVPVGINTNLHVNI